MNKWVKASIVPFMLIGALATGASANAVETGSVGQIEKPESTYAINCLKDNAICTEADITAKVEDATASSIPDGMKAIVISSNYHRHAGDAASALLERWSDVAGSDSTKPGTIVSIISDSSNKDAALKIKAVGDNAGDVEGYLKKTKSNDVNKVLTAGFKAYKDNVKAVASKKTAAHDALMRGLRNVFIGLTVVGAAVAAIVFGSMKFIELRKNHEIKVAEEKRLEEERRKREAEEAKRNRRWGEGFTTSAEGKALRKAMDDVIALADLRAEGEHDYISNEDGREVIIEKKRYGLKSQKLAATLREIVKNMDDMFVLIGKNGSSEQVKRAAQYTDFLNTLAKRCDDAYYGYIMKNPDDWTDPEKRLEQVNQMARDLNEVVRQDTKNYNARRVDNGIDADMMVLKDYQNEVDSMGASIKTGKTSIVASSNDDDRLLP